MGPVTYNVATSLDGFIAPANEATDWIIDDPSIDFDALYARFDSFVMGRKTYQAVMSAFPALPAAAAEAPTAAKSPNPLLQLQGRSRGSVVVVISSTLDPAAHPDITIVAHGGHLECIRALRDNEQGRGTWVMGGGWLAAECLGAGLLDHVELGIMPVVLGSGFNLFEGLSSSSNDGDGGDGGLHRLKLRDLERLHGSGIVMAKYDVEH